MAITTSTSSQTTPHHTLYQATPAGESFVPSLATVLTHLVSLSPADRGQVTRFHAIKAPDISIKDYLERIQKYFGCSNECFVLSLVYIDRIVKLHDEFTVSILNIHRLLITSVMLAAKFFDDVYYSNAFYVRVGGVRTKELNLLEWQFLALVDYHLFVAPREYDQYRKNVLAAVNAGIQRPLPPAAVPLKDTPRCNTARSKEGGATPTSSKPKDSGSSSGSSTPVSSGSTTCSGPCATPSDQSPDIGTTSRDSDVGFHSCGPAARAAINSAPVRVARSSPLKQVLKADRLAASLDSTADLASPLTA